MPRASCGCQARTLFPDQLLWSRTQVSSYKTRHSRSDLVRPVRSRSSGSVLQLNSSEYIAAIEEWQAPIEGVRVGTAQVRQREVRTVREERFGIRDTEGNRAGGAV